MIFSTLFAIGVPRGQVVRGEISYVEIGSGAQALIAPVERALVIEEGDVVVKRKRKPVVVAPAEPAHSSTAGTTTGGGAGAGVAEGEAVNAPIGVAGGREANARDRYLYELSLMFNQRKIYPYASRRMGETGRVTVRFHVRPDGTIDNAEIGAPSPHDRLNRAALSLVEGIGRFKPPPSTLAIDTSLEVPIEYVLE